MAKPMGGQRTVCMIAVALISTLLPMRKEALCFAERTPGSPMPDDLVGTWETSSTTGTKMTMSYTFNRDGTYEHTGYVEPGPLVRVQSIIKESGTISLQKDRLILKIRTGTFEQYDGQHQLVNRKERDDLREEEHRWRLETGRGGRTLWLDDVSYSEKR